MVELNNTPPANSGLNYSGWNRSSTPAQNATGIHHPQGDVMKISKSDNAVIRTGYFGSGNDHWQVNWSPQNNGAGQTVTAVTEPGSSGSPLFDQNHRVVGQLHGGPSFCGGTQLWDYYGSFDVSWTGGGTNATRLSNWLDPGNTGATTTNTTSVSNLIDINSLSISGDNSFCTISNSYFVHNLPAGATVHWSVTPSGIATPTDPDQLQTTLNEHNTGVITLTATITSCGTIFSVDKSYIGVGAPPISTYKVLGAGTVYSDAGYYYSLSFPLGAPYPTNINWQVPAGWTISTGQGTTNISIWTGSTGGIVAVNFDNVCGEPTGTYKTVVIGTGGPAPLFTDPSMNLKVTPNPANNSVTVSLINNTKNTNVNPIIGEIKIINKVGLVQKRFVFNNRKSSQLIDISGLPMDTYIVQAFTGGQWLSCQLLIINN